MRWLFTFASLIMFGCGGGDDDDGPTTQILALAGEVPVEAGAVVISHSGDGTVIDQQVTDGAGRAQLHTATGAYLTIIYQRPDDLHVITTPALASGVLAIHGPPPAKAPIIAGSLALTAPAIDADTITADLGCATITITAFPKVIDVAAACLGSDPNLDVLVRATLDQPGDPLVGYFAARVPTVDGAGMLDIPAWETAPTTIPITANDLNALIELDEVADGFVFANPAGTDAANAWTGLVADASRVRAQVGFTTAGQSTTQYTAGVPSSIAFTAADFLPELVTRVALADRTHLGFSWNAPMQGDVIDFHATWKPAAIPIDWDVILPPDATKIAFPALDPDLATTLAPPVGDVTLTTDLRAIDGPDTADFASVQAAGLWIDQPSGATIVPPPTSGELRAANVGGFDD